MATTDFDWSSTRNDIIQRAFRIIGVLPLGDSLSGEQQTQAVQALNDMIKSWQTRHLFLWRVQQLTLALTTGTVSYGLSTDPAVIGIQRAWLRIDNQDAPVEVISEAEYADIPDKTEAGDPIAIALRPTEVPTVFVYPVPAQNRTLLYTGICKLQDWDLAAGSGDFPVRFQRAIIFGLAYELSFEYGSLSSEEKRALRNEAEMAFAYAKASDRDNDQSKSVRSCFQNRKR